MHDFRTLAALASLAVGFASPASAQSGLYRPYPPGHPAQSLPVQDQPTWWSHGGSCVQWCIADTTPCDPTYYKVADRRCNPNQNGIFP